MRKSGQASPPRSKSVTIGDVARHAGVSVGTVSRVLNEVENCGRDVRMRVHDAVQALGYVPNYAARGLKRRLAEQLALVVPDIANPVYTQMASGVQQASSAAGYQLIIAGWSGEGDDERMAMQALDERQVDGVILCSLRMSPALERLVTDHRDAICVIGRIAENAPVDNVRVDSTIGVEAAMEHLWDTGRTRIAFVNGTPGTVPHDLRAAGFARALANEERAVDEALCETADFTMAGGYAATKRLLARKVPFDAMFCANDAMALGAMRYLQEQGRTIPRDVAVVGMDDVDAARMSIPSLTTVSLLARERGRLACELLIARMRGERDRPPQQVSVRPKLIKRESTARPESGS